MKFSEKLFLLRKQKALTQAELAEKIGVSRQAVSKWEMGTAAPELANIVALSSVFHVPIEELVAEKENSGFSEKADTPNTEPKTPPQRNGSPSAEHKVPPQGNASPSAEPEAPPQENAAPSAEPKTSPQENTSPTADPEAPPPENPASSKATAPPPAAAWKKESSSPSSCFFFLSQ